MSGTPDTATLALTGYAFPAPLDIPEALRPVTVHPAALVLAAHEVARWSRRGTVAHCDCGTATVDHAAHLADMLQQAGLLKEDT